MSVRLYCIGVIVCCVGVAIISWAGRLKLGSWGWILGSLLFLVGFVVAFWGDKIFPKISGRGK